MITRERALERLESDNYLSRQFLHTNQASESRSQIGLWLLVLLVCILPLEHWRFPFNVKPSDFALILLTLYGLLRAGQTHQRLDFPLILPIWTILLSSLFATLVGLGSPDSVIAIVQEIYIFTWFIVLTNVLKALSLSDLDRLMKIWSVIACLVSVTTVMGMLRIGPSMFYRSSYEEVTADLIRATGTFDNSNSAAVYISISLFMLLGTSWPLWLRSVLGMWLFVGMFGTGSNGALFSTLGGLVLFVGVYLALQNRRDIKLLLAAIGIGVGIAAVALLILGLASPLLSGARFDMRSPLLSNTLGRLSHAVSRRIDILTWAWKAYRRHLLGTGPNVFGSGLHNDYAAFLFERGPVGFVAWLWMIGAVLLSALQAASQLANKHQRSQVLLLGAGFLACAVNALSHEVSHMRQVWMLMAFLFALTYARSVQRADGCSGSTETDNERSWHDLRQAKPGGVATPAP